MSGNDCAIHVRDIYKRYGHIQALNGLNVIVNQGEIYGLLGANGAGKTTLIKILIGMLKQESGQAQVLGLDPIKQRQALRAQVGYMSQSPALYEDLTARQNVHFFGRPHGIDNLEKRVAEVLDFLNLADRKDDPVYGFSGGMKQRVSLACALVHRPRLLLLDEPSTGVDPKLRETLWSHFRDLAEQGVTILVSTHQMDEALHCDRVAVMRDGVVLATDSPRGLLAKGYTTVTLWHNGTSQQHILENYMEQLPKLLGIGHQYDRIEVQEDTLEDIVLKLIATREVSHV